MSVFDRLLQLFRASAPKRKTPFLTKEQVDAAYDDGPIAAGTAYCQLWLVEMRLARGVDWFKDRYPVAYTSTKYEYGGKLVTVPYIAGVDYFKGITEKNLDKIVSLNFPVTPIFPYARGVVEFKAALFSLAASQPISSFIQTMGRFTKLLPGPELMPVLRVAEELNNGLEDLFDAGQSRMELGYQQSFSAKGGGGSNDLRAGYFAVIMVPDTSFADDNLHIVKDSLYKLPEPPGPKPLPLEGYSYMLFRLEKRTEQDWEALTSVKEVVVRAQDLIAAKKTKEAKELLTAIKIAIMRSPDVVKGDRTKMFAKIEAELTEFGLQGEAGEVPRSLYQIMKRSEPSISAAEQVAWDDLERLVLKV